MFIRVNVSPFAGEELIVNADVDDEFVNVSIICFKSYYWAHGETYKDYEYCTEELRLISDPIPSPILLVIL